jgi:hypothetical protein
MKNLLVTKYPKRDCSIVNKFFRHFIVNCYIINLSNEGARDRNCFVYQIFFYISKKKILLFFNIIDVICNLNRLKFF